MLISTSTSGYIRYDHRAEALEHIRDAGYDAVDYDFYDDAAATADSLTADWREYAETLAEELRRAGLTAALAHAPFGLRTGAAYTPPAAVFHDCIRACAHLGCGELVIHPVFFPVPLDTADMREALLAYNARWVRDLLETAHACGVHIDIENTFDRRPQAFGPAFVTAADMLELLDRIGDPSVGICLDTGHAHIMAQDPAAMIRAFGPRLRALHLNDNLGPIEHAPPDLHLFPGMGALDFPGVFAALKAIGYSGALNLEPSGFNGRMTARVQYAALRAGSLLLRAYAQDAKLM